MTKMRRKQKRDTQHSDFLREDGIDQHYGQGGWENFQEEFQDEDDYYSEDDEENEELFSDDENGPEENHSDAEGDRTEDNLPCDGHFRERPPGSKVESPRKIGQDQVDEKTDPNGESGSVIDEDLMDDSHDTEDNSEDESTQSSISAANDTSPRFDTLRRTSKSKKEPWKWF